MLRRTTSIVISIHLAFIVILLFTQNRPTPARPHHITVRTIQPTTIHHPIPTASRPQKKTQPAKSPPSSPTKKPIVTDKKKVAPPQPAKAPPPPKPQAAHPAWEEIEQALAKIEQKAYPEESSHLNVPKLLQTEIAPILEIEAELVSFLHNALCLPEVGEVKVELVIRKDGTVEKIAVIRSESEKNKQYLQTHLPTLRFPMCFEQDKTWTLTFSNEI
jgi:hypothetical protein